MNFDKIVLLQDSDCKSFDGSNPKRIWKYQDIDKAVNFDYPFYSLLVYVKVHFYNSCCLRLFVFDRELEANQLSGSIPPDIGNLTAIQQL